MGAILSGLLALALLALPQEPARSGESVERVLRALAEVRAAPNPDLHEEGARLAKLGRDVVPILLDVLQAENGELVDERQEEVVVVALASFRRAEVVDELTRAALASPSPRVRANCLRVLGAVGEARDLAVLCNAAAPEDPARDVDPRIAPALERACAQILERDLGAAAVAQSLVRERPPNVRIHLIRALGESGSPACLWILSQRLGAEAVEDPLLLSEIARVARSVPLPVDPPVLDGIRRYLDSDDPILLQSAMRALGRLEDVGCVARLIEHLSDPNPPIREAAHAALTSIGGVSLTPERDRWNHWLLEESEWLAKQEPGLRDLLRNGSVEEKVRAIARLCEHPLYRHEVAGALLRALPGENALVRRFGCGALGQLGLPAAIPFLEQSASDRDAGVAAAASSALEQIRRKRR